LAGAEYDLAGRADLTWWLILGIRDYSPLLYNGLLILVEIVNVDRGRVVARLDRRFRWRMKVRIGRLITADEFDRIDAG